MSNIKLQHISASAGYALITASLVVTLILTGFFFAEPQISHSQVDTSDFTITQTIVDETSFTTPAVDVIMNGAGINGVTGGQATGTTQFVVASNNATGYRVEIEFEDNFTTSAMLGHDGLDTSILNYEGDVAGEPSYGFTTSASAQFAYTVTATTSSDLDQSFLSNGSNTCNTGASQYPIGEYCWKAPSSTAAFQIIDRGTAASAGATSTLTFTVHVPSGAVPVPSAQDYTATATLSLYTQ